MNRPRCLPSFARLALAVAAVLAPVTLHATGDFYEEPLLSLPDFLKLDQLPAKTFSTIRDETAPETGEKAEEFDVDKELAALEGKPGREVLAGIDKLLVRARKADDTPALRALNDLRDLYAGPATAAETADYIAWRGTRVEFTAAELAERLKKASPALRPHYLVLEGARVFAEGNDIDCQPFFEEVLKNSPKHPRAEVALYMLGRTQVSRGRGSGYTQHDRELNPAQRPRGKKLLDEYLAKYPKGRWAGDALGWLGAWYYDGNEFSDALRCYLSQLAMTDHPELADSALKMCDATLSHLASAARDKSWAEVAKHPEAAQALVYLLLNSAESDNYNGELDTADQVRAWRKKLLPQVAAAIAAQEKLYKDATWRPRYLATLALAASGNGQQDQALKLLATLPPGTENDDVLLARGVALQRAKRSKEAIAVFEQLLERFPESPLARGTRLRLALAQADNHEAGQAILTLDTFREKKEGEPDPDPNPSDRGEVDGGFYATHFEVPLTQVGQLIDLWLNFAPIEELATPAQAPGFDPVKRLRFTEAIAQRLLAKEQFDEAKKYMTPAQFGLVAGPIEKLTIAARDAKEPAARAMACLALADAWAGARGKLLTFPLDTEKTRKDVYPYEDPYANVRRADAATVLGYTGSFRVDLENRDELRHAFNWWIEASDQQPGTPTTATALWRALRAMPLIADVSPFTYERALSRKWAEVSRKLYDRLRTECADSEEAKRLAVYWNFPVPKKVNPEDDDDGYLGRDAAGAGLPVADIFEAHASGPDDDIERKSLTANVEALVAAAKTETPAALKARMEKKSAEARAEFTGLYDARWVNYYDDLALFFSEPDPGPDVRARYVQLRSDFLENSAIGGAYEAPAGADDGALGRAVDEELKDPAVKPVADYFEFVKLAIIANHFTQISAKREPKEDATKKDAPKEGEPKKDEAKEEEPVFSEKGEGYDYRSRDYVLLAKETKAFLDKYPKSRKREAALLLHARAVYRASAEVTLRNFQTWPQATRWEGGYALTVTSQEPFDVKKVLAALDAYDKAFPKGRYSADIRDYRAEVALRLHDWKTVVPLTIAQIHDDDREDLHEAAAFRLDNLFTQLADERYRPDLLPVIKADPKAKALLLKYLAHESDVHPLRYLTGYLREQLGAREAAAPPAKRK